MLPRPPALGDPAGAKGRSTLTQRLATALLEKLGKLQTAGALPRKETCDMIILDRWGREGAGGGAGEGGEAGGDAGSVECRRRGHCPERRRVT